MFDKTPELKQEAEYWRENPGRTYHATVFYEKGNKRHFHKNTSAETEAGVARLMTTKDVGWGRPTGAIQYPQVKPTKKNCEAA